VPGDDRLDDGRPQRLQICQLFCLVVADEFAGHRSLHRLHDARQRASIVLELPGAEGHAEDTYGLIESVRKFEAWRTVRAILGGNAVKLTTYAASVLVLAGVVVSWHPALSQGAMGAGGASMAPQPRVAPMPQAPAPVRAPTIVPSAPVMPSGAPQGIAGGAGGWLIGNGGAGGTGGTTTKSDLYGNGGDGGAGGAGSTITNKGDTTTKSDLFGNGGAGGAGGAQKVR
jgi:hypothetical protein